MASLRTENPGIEVPLAEVLPDRFMPGTLLGKALAGGTVMCAVKLNADIT